MNVAIFPRILIWCFALLAGLLAAISSLSAITASRNPAAAVQLWPQNGFAVAKFSNLQIAAYLQENAGETNLDKMSPRQLQSIEQMAKSSLLSEPAAEESAVALGLVYEASEQMADASALMNLVGTMTKRSASNSLWLINEAASSKDTQLMVEHYDRVLKTNRTARPIMFQQLSVAMENDIFIGPMTALLEQNPVWQEGFWNSILKNPLAFENAAKLRIELTKSGKKEVGRLDKALIMNLVRAKQFETAYSLYAKLADPSTLDMYRSRLSTFSQEPVMPPFDWQLSQTGEYGARIDADQKILELSSLGSGAGRFARQLLALNPESYRLVISYGEQQPTGKVQLSLSCAEVGFKAEKITPISLSSRNNPPLNLSSNRCHWYYLDIVGNALDDSDTGFDMAISKLQLVPTKTAS